MVLLSHLARATLTNKMIPEMVQRVNHVLTPIPASGRTGETVLPEMVHAHDAPKDLPEFFGRIKGCWVDFSHGLERLVRNFSIGLMRSGRENGHDSFIFFLVV